MVTAEEVLEIVKDLDPVVHERAMLRALNAAQALEIERLKADIAQSTVVD